MAETSGTENGTGLSRQQAAIYRLAAAALAFAFVGMLVIFWALAYPRDRVVIKEPIAVWPKQVRAGSGIRLFYEYCKSDPAMAIVGGYLASRGVLIPIQHLWASALPIGCHSVNFDLQIPGITPPGNYKLYLTREYRPTIFTQSHYLSVTEAFDVIADDDPVRGEPAAPLPEFPPGREVRDRPANDPPTPWWKRAFLRWQTPQLPK